MRTRILIVLLSFLLGSCASKSASYHYMQKQLEHNDINFHETLKVDEYLNAFSQDWLQLPKDEELVIKVDPLTNVETDDKQNSIFQIALKTRNPTQKEIGEPIGLCLVIDVSGSMGGEKIDDTKQALISAIQEFKNNDVISLVTFNNDSQVIASKIVINRETREKLIGNVKNLYSSGGTNIGAGLVEGYRELAKFPSGINKRLIILTDGVSTVETISPKDIADKAKVNYLEDARISTIGLGYDVDQKILRKIAEVGNGHYYFAENSKVLTKYLREDIQTTVIPVAKNISLNLDLGKGYVFEKFYGYSPDNLVGKQSVKILLEELNVNDWRIIIVEIRKILKNGGQPINVSGTFFSIKDNSQRNIQDLKTGLITNKNEIKNINEYVLRNAILFGNAVSLIEVSKLNLENKYEEALRIIDTQINNNEILLKIEQSEMIEKERVNLKKVKSIILTKIENRVSKQPEIKDNPKSLNSNEKANGTVKELILSGLKISSKALPGLWGTIAQLLIVAIE